MGPYCCWLRQVFTQFMLPTAIITDKGPQFRSQEFSLFWRREKTGIQVFPAAGKTWEAGIQNLLFQLCTLPASPEGRSPAELFLSHHLRLAFEVAVPDKTAAQGGYLADTQLDASPGTPSCPVALQKLRPLFNKGEQVLAKRPHCPKGQSPYSGPLTVTEVLDRYSFKLSDGQKWSARCLKEYYAPEGQWMGFEDPLVQQGADIPEDRRVVAAPREARNAALLRRSAPANFGMPPDWYNP